MRFFPKKPVYWFVCREYAGIAEAGGVKNIVRSLCEGLSRRGNRVTVFMPRYSFSNLSKVTGLSGTGITGAVQAGGASFPVTFSRGVLRGVEIVFAESPVFEHRRSVYTYTAEDERENPAHTRGRGFDDAQTVTVVFQKAVAAYAAALRSKDAPRIVHCHDATCALIPVFARETPEARDFFADSAFAVSIHNAGPSYHHEFHSLEEARFLTALPEEVLRQGMNGHRVEPYLLASLYGRLLTVSPWYAEELTAAREWDNSDGLAAAFSSRGIPITGITNGIDYKNYDPRKPEVSLLPCPYDPTAGKFAGKERCKELFFSRFSSGKDGSRTAQDGLPEDCKGIDAFGFLDAGRPLPVLFGHHGRLVSQKGIDVLAGAIEALLSRDFPAAFALCGQGEAGLEDRLIALAARFPGKVVFFRGYDRLISRYCTAAADFLVLPSNFEPCGLEDLIAQLFGVIPAAHATGGLKKIIHGETGFLYEKNDAETLSALLGDLGEDFPRNKDKYRAMSRNAARYAQTRYSWNRVLAEDYIPLYKELRAAAPIS